MSKKTMSSKFSSVKNSTVFTAKQRGEQLTASIVGSLRVEGYAVTAKAVDKQISEHRKKK